MTAPLTDEARAAAEKRAWAERAYRFEVLHLTLFPQAIFGLEAHDPAEAKRLWKMHQAKLVEIREGAVFPLTPVVAE